MLLTVISENERALEQGAEKSILWFCEGHS